MKVNKVAILMGVAGLVYGTSSNAFYNVDAALTSPTTWTYGFNYRAASDLFELRNFNRSNYGWPGFVRLADGAYYDYEWSSVTGHFDDGDSSNDAYDPPQDILPDGLEVEMIFNRSNSTWFTGGGNNTGFYFADDTKIGSDNTVGSIDNKVYLNYNNQTNKDYRLWLDLSSGATTSFQYRVDSNGYGNTELFIYNDASTYTTLWVSAYTEVNITYGTTSGIRYLDAWYLQDLGVSSSYDEGYDEGYDAGENAVIASGGLQGIIEGVFEGIVAIFGIEIFNGVSLGAVALFPLVITLFVFVMKIVKMGG
jgi:hypothetical protein